MEPAIDEPMIPIMPGPAAAGAAGAAAGATGRAATAAEHKGVCQPELLRVGSQGRGQGCQVR